MYDDIQSIFDTEINYSRTFVSVDKENRIDTKLISKTSLSLFDYYLAYPITTTNITFLKSSLPGSYVVTETNTNFTAHQETCGLELNTSYDKISGILLREEQFYFTVDPYCKEDNEVLKFRLVVDFVESTEIPESSNTPSTTNATDGYTFLTLFISVYVLSIFTKYKRKHL